MDTIETRSEDSPERSLPSGESLSFDELVNRLNDGIRVSYIEQITRTDPSEDLYNVETNDNFRCTIDREQLQILINNGAVSDTIQNTLFPQLIQPNPSSLRVSETTSRFRGALWFNAIEKTRITLAGVGGIGSYVAFLLSRIHPLGIQLYDPDIVEEGNLSGQLYSKNSIGKYKVEEIAKFMRTYSNYYGIVASRSAFSIDSAVKGVAICGFDNMTARRTFFYVWRSLPDEERELFIDGRLSAEEFQVIAIQGDDEDNMKEYEKNWLFDDSEAEAEVCSYKQTSYMANMIASVMVNILVNYIANKQSPLMPYEVPFLTTYSGNNMFFKVRV